MLPGKVLMKFHFQAAGAFCSPVAGGIRYLGKKKEKKRKREKCRALESFKQFGLLVIIKSQG